MNSGSEMNQSRPRLVHLKRRQPLSLAECIAEGQHLFLRQVVKIAGREDDGWSGRYLKNRKSADQQVDQNQTGVSFSGCDPDINARRRKKGASGPLMDSMEPPFLHFRLASLRSNIGA